MQGVFRACEPLETDERQRVLLATARLLCSDEDVHLRELAVPHPVHERDLRSVIVEVAEGVGTVEKNAEGRVLGCPGGIRRVLCDGRDEEPCGRGHGRRLRSW